jgi:hypothetical protein
MRVVAINLLLVLVLSIAALLAFEFLPFGDNKLQRLLYYSVNPWQKNSYEGDFFITLQPDQTIRSYASYGGEVDYDTTFTTDSNGFRNDKALPLDGSIVSVVGDSFTMGTGGPNWVETLSSHHRDLGTFFYNNGVSGTGTRHWMTLIDYLHRDKGINRFVIIMIEEDLTRKKVYSVEGQDGRISKCLGDDCTPMDIITNEELGYLYLQRKNPLAFYFPKTHAYLYLPLKRSLRREVPHAKKKRFNAFFAFLKSRDYSNFLWIKIPSKTGVRLGTSSFRLPAKAANVAYVEAECLNGLADFYPNDGHPNEMGYARLSRCIAEIIAQHVDLLIPRISNKDPSESQYEQ